LANQRRSRKILFSTLGVALALPLIAVPASAALDGGGFFVRAQNSAEPEKYSSVAGQRGTGSSGGGVEAPGEVDTSEIFANYSCGPLKVDVTQAMLDLTRANLEAQAQGRTADIKTHADGWQLMSYYDESDYSMKAGFPEDGSRPGLVQFGGMTVGEAFQVDDSSKLFAMDMYGGCNITDLRGTPRDGGVYSYSTSSYSTSETRYEKDGERLNLVTSSVMSDGEKSIRRFVPKSTYFAQSESKPYSVLLFPDGAKQAAIYYSEVRDGYNSVNASTRADGSGSVVYLSLDGKSSVPEDATRSQGPFRVLWDSQGNMTTAIASDGRGGSTVAEYNAATGQSWDGSYLKYSDLDTSIPFEVFLSQ